MHRTPFPSITIIFAVCILLCAGVIFGQTKSAGSVDAAKCWSYSTGQADGAGIASDGSRVFIGLGGAKVEAITSDGRKLWSTELGGSVSSNLLPLEGGLILATATSSGESGKPGGSVIRSLSKETGITNWTSKLPEADRHFLGGFNGAVIVVSTSGVIQSIDAGTGVLKWKRDIASGFVAEPVFNGGKVIAAAAGKQIFGVSMTTGEIESLRKSVFGVTALGETPAGALITGDERGNVTFFANGTDKINWKFKTGGEISGIVAVGENLLITSHDNFVYFLTGRNGNVAWKKRLPGRVSHIATTPGKFAISTSFEEHGAAVTDILSGKSAGQIALGVDESLVYDPVSANDLILMLTNQAVYAYSLNGCAAKSDPPV